MLTRSGIVASGGVFTQVGGIQATIVLDGLSIGASIAEFSVVGQSGTFTFSFSSNPGNLFSLSGNQLLLAGVLSVGTLIVGIQATNGTLTLNQNFTFNVKSVSPSFVVGAQPFTPNSPVNKTLANWQPVTQLWPVNMPPGNATHGPYGFQNYYAGIKFQVDSQPPSSSPIVNFTAPNSWGNPQAVFNEPMTSGFTGNGDAPDNEAIYIAADGTFQSLYNFTRSSDTAATVGAYAFCNGITSTGFGNPVTGVGAGTVAAGTSNYLGTLVKQEAIKGSINHFLVMGMLGASQVPNLCNTGHYAPAIVGDGNSTNGFIQEGQMMAIDSNASLPGGLSQWGPILFTTMKNYGVMVHDTSGSIVFYGADDYANPSNNWSSGDLAELVSDMNIIAPMLKKVGCYLDGIQTVIGTQFQCGPRLALISYTGQISAGGLTSGGSGYQPGTYTVAVGPAPGSLGTGAQATIVVGSGGGVTSVTITNEGSNFIVGDVLTASPNSIGTNGSGLAWTVTSVTSGNCLTVTRSSDGTSSPIGYVNGYLDTTALTAFCAGPGTVGRVSGYNDSVGNFSPAAPTGTAPIIFQSGAVVTMGGKPAMLFNGTSNVLKIPSSSSINPVPNGKLFYFCATVQVSNRAAHYGLFGSDAAGGLEVRIDATTGYVRLLLNNGTLIGVSATAVALNSPTCIEVTYNPQTGSFVIFQNRAQTASGTNQQSITAGNVLIGTGGTGTDLFNGMIGDVLICASPSDPFPNVPQYTINRGAQQYWNTL